MKQYLFLVFLCLSFCGCEEKQKAEKLANYKSYRDIPGVTEEEIRDIEELKKKNKSFTYGMVHSVEAFDVESGEVKGYSALLCDWFSKLFDIPFKPKTYEWGDLLYGLESGEVDFTGDLTFSEERIKTYSMTAAIAQRNLKYFRIVNSHPLSQIAFARPLRFGMFKGTITNRALPSIYSSYEIITVAKIDEIYDKLKNGEIDAFVEENVLEAAFDVYGDVISEDFYPLVYNSVSMATQNPELKSVISVVNKALQNGSMKYLNDLYNIGQREYKKHKLSVWLSDEERAYIKNNPVIRLVAEFDNYPTSFYNERENKWQGISFDVLHKIEDITGLHFEQVNDKPISWHVVLKMLEDGDASIVSELIYSDERKGRFLWAEKANLKDNYALISKAEYKDVDVNEILYAKIGVNKGSAHDEVLHSWFPNHMNLVEFENSEKALEALENGEVDMMMTGRSKLLSLTNYKEIVGYKASIVFDYTFESVFGFNKEEKVLHSIVNKALKLIDTRAISGHWMRKTFDYRVKMMQARIPWIIGVSALFSLLLLSLIFFYKKSRDAEKEANHAKSDFLAKMSHEIRTPMNVILGIADVQLQNENLEPKVAEGLNAIYNSSESLLRIINDLLDLSKIEAGKMEIVPAKYNLASFIKDIVQLNQINIEKKALEFTLSVDENLPLELFGDELRVKQILTNLLSNSFKYTEKGSINLSFSAEQKDSNNVVLILGVSDTGQGMTKEQVRKIFDEYSRFNLGANRKVEGTGLGMNITKRLTQMMGGKIIVDSEPGKGTSFIVHLPQESAGSEVFGKKKAENLQKFKKSNHHSKRAKIIRESMPYGSVLVVDDVELNLYVASQLLIPYDLHIETASSGFEAIDKIKEGKSYDIIFMDHMMPKMDGIETVKIIRSMSYSKPIIALTANAITGQSEIFSQNGFDGFISKPIDIHKLNDELNKFIRDRKTEF